MGWSLARVTCETSQVLLAGGQVFFLGDLPYLPHHMIKKNVPKMSFDQSLLGALLVARDPKFLQADDQTAQMQMIIT